MSGRSSLGPQSSASCFEPFWLNPALALCSPWPPALEKLSGTGCLRARSGGGGPVGAERGELPAAHVPTPERCRQPLPWAARLPGPCSARSADLYSRLNLPICPLPPQVELVLV